MRIAISTDGDSVSAHFGRCPFFTIVDIEESNVTGKERIGNPGHHPGVLPRFLSQRGVKCIIAGGMGQRAQELFSEEDIERIVGISGSIDSVIESLRAGTLKGGESLCQPGKGKGYGVGKTECDHPKEGHEH